MANEETNGGNLMKAAELLDAAGNIVAGTHQGMAAQIKELESFKERLSGQFEGLTQKIAEVRTEAMAGIDAQIKAIGSLMG